MNGASDQNEHSTRQDAADPGYKWVVLSITTIGVLMAAIDNTIVILALPAMMTELHSNLVAMIWVLMAYIFVSTVLLLALGRIADIYGRVRLYNFGFAIFTLGSCFCGLSQSGHMLIGARVFQGAGGALMLVNAWPIITEAFPPNQRGMAMGINSMTSGLGGVIGPVLGGLILSIASWRWIFFINIPIGIAGTYFGYIRLKKMPRPRAGEHLDWLGAITFSIGLFALLYALTQGIQLGWTSSTIIGLFAFFIVSIAFFVFWEHRAKCPALDLTLFQNRVYDFSVLAATFQSLAIYAVQFLIVFYLQAVRGYDPLTAALLLLPMPLGLAITGPFGGRLSDKIGARVPATVGLLIQAGGVYWLSTLTATSHYSIIAIGLILTGIGGGLFYSPNTSAAMSTSPRDRLGVASATLATLRNAGMVTSFAIALAVAASAMPRAIMLKVFIGTASHLGSKLMVTFVDGMNSALRVSVGLSVIAALMSLVRGREGRRNIEA